MDRVRVSPAPHPPNDYDVVVRAGGLRELGALLAYAAPAARYAVVADAAVAALHGDAALSALEKAGLPSFLVTFAPGEASKTRETWAALTDALLAERLGRDGCVVALGGGVACDLAGFVAATYLRGVPVAHVPTSLVAMVDASVGGKTGVDVAAGKNLVGAFHQPRLVLADPELLGTLPARELRAGLAEALKHGAIADAAYFDSIVDGAAGLLAGDAAALGELVRRSVRIKAAIVAADPLEAGERASLNFGHTIAHALETRSGYALGHGEAVAIGMVVEADAGERAGVTRQGTADRLRYGLARVGLPTSVPEDASPAEVVAATASDKKVRRGRSRYTLLAGLGEVARDAGGAWTHALEDAVVEAAVAAARRPPGGRDSAASGAPSAV